MWRRKHGRLGKASLALGIGFLLAERYLTRRGIGSLPALTGTGVRWTPLRERLGGWQGITSRLILRRLGYYSPTGIALRLGVRVLRRYFL